MILSKTQTTLALSLLINLAAAPQAYATATCANLFTTGPTAQELKLITQLRKDAAAYFKANFKLPEADAARQLELFNAGEISKIEPTTIADIVKYEPGVASAVQKKLADMYVKLAKQSGRTPIETEVAEGLGLQPAEFKELLGDGRLFPDLTSIKESAQQKNPKAFDKVIDLQLFSPERMALLENALLNRQRFFITTAVARTPVDKEFFAALLRSAKELDAEILVFPSNMQTTGLDPILLDTPGVHIITNTVMLSPNLTVNNIKIMAKMINPLAGLHVLGQRGESQIVGSPQIRLKTLATVDNDIAPHMMMTTGALTIPVYNSKQYIGERTNKLAEARHRMGALLVEKSMGNIKTKLPGNPIMSGFFHSRFVRYVPEAKGFTDLDKFYTAGGVSKANIMGVIFPDIHVGEMSPAMQTNVRGVLKKFRPSFVGIHDLFNGHTINKHERDQQISRMKNYVLGSLNLEDELRSVATFLNTLTTLDSNIEVRIEYSNHDQWLAQWLQKGYFLNETHNMKIGLELAQAMSEGKSPLETALRKVGLRFPERIIFVTEVSQKIGDHEAGQHGHIGGNGSKGSLTSLAPAANMITKGHSHTTEIDGDGTSVGTFTRLRQGYNGNGPSSWSNSLVLIDQFSRAQLLLLKQDELWAEKPAPTGKNFFGPGYPNIVPNNDPGVGLQIDQYSHFSK